MIRFIGDIYPGVDEALPMDSTEYLVANLSTLMRRIDTDLVKGLKPYQEISQNLVLGLNYLAIGEREDQLTEKLFLELEGLGIDYFGLWESKKEVEPYFLYSQNMKIAILSFCDDDLLMKRQSHLKFRMHPYDESLVKEGIGVARSKGADRILIQMNWSEKEGPAGSKRQRKIAHWLMNQGADLILGYQTGSIQSYELYQNKSIFYGLGNFLMKDIVLKGDDICYVKYQRAWNLEGLSIDYDPYHNSVVRVDKIALVKGEIQVKRHWALAEYFGGEYIGFIRKIQSKTYRWMKEMNPKIYEWLRIQRKIIHNSIRK